MPTRHSVLDQEETTVKEYLDQSDDNLKKLIEECEGIIHYTRSGTRTVVDSTEFELKKGDFLFVADACSTGEAHEQVAPDFQSIDYAFVHPDDSFGQNAEYYIIARPDTEVIDTSRSLKNNLSIIISGDEVNNTINDIIIVSHASGEVALFLKLNDDDQNDNIEYYELCEYISKEDRPKVTDRYIKNDSSIHIRGCNVGREKRFLKLLQQLFGGEVTVTAPRHYDVFGHSYYNYSFRYSEGGDRTSVQWSTALCYEYMCYNFSIYSSKKADSRDEVVEMFDNKKFSNIYDNSIEKDTWNEWVPAESVIHSGDSVELDIGRDFPSEVTSYVEEDFLGRDHPDSLDGHLNSAATNQVQEMNNGSYGEYSYEERDTINDDIIVSKENKKNALKKTIRNMEDEVPGNCDSGRFPWYERLVGVNNLDDYLDLWGFRDIEENDGDNKVKCIPPIHQYTLQIPISNSDGELIMNAFAITADSDAENVEELFSDLSSKDIESDEYLVHDLKTSDDRFFGIV